MSSWPGSWTRRTRASQRSHSESGSHKTPGSDPLVGFCNLVLLGPSPAADPEEGPDTDSDLMLAQMLQMQFDREFDDQLRREERKFNGDSKGRAGSGSGPASQALILDRLLNLHV